MRSNGPACPKWVPAPTRKAPRLAPMSAARQQFGELGERIAERWLRRQGWRVVQRRFRNGHCDIDLVVEREGTIVFVEVKARRGREFGDPVEAGSMDLTHTRNRLP